MDLTMLVILLGHRSFTVPRFRMLESLKSCFRRACVNQAAYVRVRFSSIFEGRGDSRFVTDRTRPPPNSR